MYQETIENIKKLIKDDKVKEVVTKTNGTRKVTVSLKNGVKEVYYGDEATEVLNTTNKY